MYKSFPVCHDGDQFSVKFQYREEKDAFDQVVSKLELLLKDFDSGKSSIKSRKIFRTTLQKEAAESKVNEIMKIFGLHVFNIFDDVTIIIRYKKE